jgi:hypothetical protein
MTNSGNANSSVGLTFGNSFSNIFMPTLGDPTGAKLSYIKSIIN